MKKITKALIFNSGLGKRMGELTQNNPKCMVKLYNDETVFERQIRILSNCGITEFVITTGPFKEQLEEVSKKFPHLKFTFVNNPVYDKTNYIYSMFLAHNYILDDLLLLHGDLVFNENLIIKMLNSEEKSLCLINENEKLPEKDFKGRIKDNNLKEVSINIFDNDCYAFQPLYKLQKIDMISWLEKIVEFVKKGYTDVYAENALNEILENLNIRPMSYSNEYIQEVDTIDDLNRVSQEIKTLELVKSRKI